MTQRIIIGLKQNTDVSLINKALVSLGAEILSYPSTYQPNVLVVTIPKDWNMEEYLQKIKSLKGVNYAEEDAWRSTC